MKNQESNKMDCGCSSVRCDTGGNDDEAVGPGRLTTIVISYPEDESLKDCITGAIMGAFIGDALGFGCVYYYGVEDLRIDFG